MKKNMYSLMLAEDVIRAIDDLAEEKGTNRSNLVNQILAEYVSLKTPEKRVQNIFDISFILLDLSLICFFNIEYGNFRRHHKPYGIPGCSYAGINI